MVVEASGRSFRPQISVVIPFHGDYSDFSGNCLQSLRSQSYTNFDVILILDGPSPFRNRLLEDMKASGLAHRVMENPRNMGLLQTRIRASRKASGAYIAFLDHDDTYEPNFLGEMYRKATESDADIVECPLNEVEPDGHAHMFQRFGCDDMRQGSEILHSYFAGGSHNTLPNKLIRKAVWDASCGNAASYWNGSYINFCEDMVFTLNVYSNAALYAATCGTHYNYLKRPVSAVSPVSFEALRNSLNQFSKVMDYVDEEFSGSVPASALRAFHDREVTWALDRFESRIRDAKDREQVNANRVRRILRKIALLRRRFLATGRGSAADRPESGSRP